MNKTIRTLRELRETLLAQPLDAKVLLDGKPPTALSSWRGVYAELAVERSKSRHEQTKTIPGHSSTYYDSACPKVQIKADATVGDFIEALNLADGETFEGYKGGHYTMGGDTDIWVSEYGAASHVRVMAARLADGVVHLDLIDVGW